MTATFSNQPDFRPASATNTHGNGAERTFGATGPFPESTSLPESASAPRPAIPCPGVQGPRAHRQGATVGTCTGPARHRPSSARSAADGTALPVRRPIARATAHSQQLPSGHTGAGGPRPPSTRLHAGVFGTPGVRPAPPGPDARSWRLPFTLRRYSTAGGAGLGELHLA